MMVRESRVGDYLEVAALHAAYRARVHLPEAEMDEAGRSWRIAEHDGRVAGAYGYSDDTQAGLRVILDFYVAPGRIGKVACDALWNDAREQARAQRLDIVGAVVPQNAAQLRAMVRRGFEPLAVLLRYTTSKGD